MTTGIYDNAELYRVRRPAGPVNWTVDVPGSKSITNRALLLAALSDGSVQLAGAQMGDDARTFLEALRALGFSVRVDEALDCATVTGCGGRIPRPEAEIDVGSAGTAARFLTAMLGLSDGTWMIDASEQMQRRPMRPLFEALCALGAQVTWRGEAWHLPVRLNGAAARRDIAADQMSHVDLDIGESTQFLSALLMAAPMLPGGLCIHLTGGKKGGPYVEMTRRMMERFGVSVRSPESFPEGKAVYEVAGGASYKADGVYQVEPDVSAACYFYAAAAVTGGTVRVNRVSRGGLQGDLMFLDVLEQMGCAVADSPEGVTVSGPAPGGLHGLCVDMRDFSDQALTLAAIAPFADGPVEITNIAHVRAQESDRIHAIAGNLARAGIVCEERPDGVRIEPGTPAPCRIETFDDHRVAMAFAVMGLGADGIEIVHPGCCRKTFAHYFDLLDALLDESGESRESDKERCGR